MQTAMSKRSPPAHRPPVPIRRRCSLLPSPRVTSTPPQPADAFKLLEALALLTSAVVEGPQLSIADRVHALTRRFIASQRRCSCETALLLSEVGAAGREDVFVVRQLARYAEKAWEGAAEEVRVRAAQLEAYAHLLEREAEPESVACVARALLSHADFDITTSIIAVDWDSNAALRASDQAVRIRDGVDPALCSVGGTGVCEYQVGVNRVNVWALDCENNAVETLEEGDVCVSVHGGASMISVAMSLTETGQVEAVYTVPVGCVEPVTVRVSVCGVQLSGSPWTVEHSALEGSAILAHVAIERTAAFTRKLERWLPDRSYTLLYRGSRDGMTAAAFHGLCDGKGPTLVLIRCTNGWVFGGHAGASWQSNDEFVASADAFLFSVTGPYTAAAVRFPVKAVDAREALYCHASYGPCFYHGLVVASDTGSPTACFDVWACGCDVGESWSCYDDVIGHGFASLTGDCVGRFTPAEVEVFAVT